MPYAQIQVDSYFRYCIIVISVYDRDRDRDRLRLSINTVNRHLGFRGFASTTCKIVPTPATLCKHALATPLEVSSFVAIVTLNLASHLTGTENKIFDRIIRHSGWLKEMQL